MRAEGGDRPREEGSDPGCGQPEDLPDLLVGQVALVAQVDDLPLAVREHSSELLEPQPELRAIRGHVRVPWFGGRAAAEWQPPDESSATPAVGDDPAGDEQQPRQ